MPKIYPRYTKSLEKPTKNIALETIGFVVRPPRRLPEGFGMSRIFLDTRENSPKMVGNPSNWTAQKVSISSKMRLILAFYAEFELCV